jgi:DHA2 family methylenomycin A resistance protein-like MFS transporter
LPGSGILDLDQRAAERYDGTAPARFRAAAADVPAARLAAPAQAGLAGGLFNAGRQTGGALAVATFGTLVAGSFLTGMRVSMLISAVLLLLSTAAAFAVFRGRA